MSYGQTVVNLSKNGAKKKSDALAVVGTAHGGWLFTDVTSDIAEAESVLFGSTPEEVVEKLIGHLGLETFGGRVKHFLLDTSRGPVLRGPLEVPRFVYDKIEDVKALPEALAKYPRLQVRQRSNDHFYGGYQTARAMSGKAREEIARMTSLLPDGYFVNLDYIASYNPKQAAIARKRITRRDVTLSVLRAFAAQIARSLPFEMETRQRHASTIIQAIIERTAAIDGLYGKNAYWRSPAFREMAKWWQTRTGLSPLLKDPRFAYFFEWLECEFKATRAAAKRPQLEKLSAPQLLRSSRRSVTNEPKDAD